MNLVDNFQSFTSPPTLPARKPRLSTRSLYRSTRRRYTGKEQDSETGLHYYGARYLDSRTGRWLSGDPAVGDYVPQAGKGGNGLPGMGGVYNTVNLHLYHYAGNNPVKYTDPDGREDEGVVYVVSEWEILKEFNKPENRVKEDNDSNLCNYNTLVGAVEERTGRNIGGYTKDQIRKQLQSGDDPAVFKDGTVKMADDVLNSALESVGMGDELSASLHSNKPANFDKIDPKNILTQRRFENEKGELIHANLGDSKGNFLWESLHYNNADNIRTGPADKLRYIIFTEKKK